MLMAFTENKSAQGPLEGFICLTCGKGTTSLAEVCKSSTI